MKRLFLYTLISFALSFASLEALSLLSLQKESQAGDYFTALSQQEVLFYAVLENTPQSFTVQIATTSKNNLKKTRNWKTWAERGAPGATANILLAFHPKQGSLLWAYDLQKQKRGKFNDENILTTLLHLFLQPQEKEKRKKKYLDQKTGPQYWSPAVRYHGKSYPQTQLTPWEAQWPEDGSELSKQKIVVYLATEDARFPPYIPFLIEVGTGGTKQALRILDAGQGYTPPFSLPHIFVY